MKVFHLNLIRIFGFVDKRNHYILEFGRKSVRRHSKRQCRFRHGYQEDGRFFFFFMYVMYFLYLYFFIFFKINLIMICVFSDIYFKKIKKITCEPEFSLGYLRRY